MTKEEVEDILLADDITYYNYTDRIVRGLLIIRKYIPNADITRLYGNILETVAIDDLISAGLDENDCYELAALGWEILFLKLGYRVHNWKLF